MKYILSNRKDCFCFTCEKGFNHLGIARHRAMHRDNREDCEIMYSGGTTRFHEFNRCRIPIRGK